jgi:protocatechuate 3,4-dioxygenase beta subunit
MITENLTRGRNMDTRRNFLKLAGLGGLTTIATFKGAQALADCDFRQTPKQPLGPFYPKEFPIDTDVDLTKLGNRSARAKGELVIVSGVVTDDFCRPIKGAIVEIWQACHTGRYNHPSDTSENPLDPDFQYYGTMKTNEKGEYFFKTIKPGAYLATETWRRPPHIHYKVSLRGYQELVTQLYFAGDSLNQHDRILQELDGDDKKKVVVNFERDHSDGESILKGVFDMTLKKA